MCLFMSMFDMFLVVFMLNIVVTTGMGEFAFLYYKALYRLYVEVSSKVLLSKILSWGSHWMEVLEKTFLDMYSEGDGMTFFFFFFHVLKLKQSCNSVKNRFLFQNELLFSCRIYDLQIRGM